MALILTKQMSKSGVPVQGVRAGVLMGGGSPQVSRVSVYLADRALGTGLAFQGLYSKELGR